MDGNPIEFLFSWQSTLCAVAAWGLTQAIKTAIDLRYDKRPLGAPPDGPYRAPANPLTPKSVDRPKWINALLLPAIPVAIGALFGAVVPLRPEIVTEYVAANVEGWHRELLSFAAWGAACGQFSSSLYDRARGLIRPG